MTVTAWIVFVFVALFALLVAERRSHRAVIVIKPLVSTGFIAVALASGALGSTYGQIVLVALALSWLGDVLLIPREARRAFLAGLLAFLGGHVAYAAAFVVLGLDAGAVVVAAVPLGILAATVGRYLANAAPPKLRRPVVGYIVVISVMVATAAGAVSAGAPARILLGAVMFYLSDLGVARERFVQKSFWNRAITLPLYYGAQVLFATSV